MTGRAAANSASFHEWKLIRIKQLAAARLHEMACVSLVDQANPKVKTDLEARLRKAGIDTSSTQGNISSPHAPLLPQPR